MPTIVTRDGTEIYYKDWGSGPPVVFSHGWPLSADSWEAQMLFLASHGFRCIAHDRRGHGRSSQPWDGNEMDTYADDLAALIDALDLRGATLFGFSTGGGEVARYIGRHGTARVADAGLISAVPPLMVKTERNPNGLPDRAVFDGLRAASLADRSQLYQDLASGPFFGYNRPGATPSQGVIDAFWMQGMQAGHKNALDCIKAFSETDFTDDLASVRRAHAGAAWQRRPDRADRLRRADVGRAHRHVHAEGLPGCPARHHRHPPRPAQRRPAGLPARRTDRHQCARARDRRVPSVMSLQENAMHRPLVTTSSEERIKSADGTTIFMRIVAAGGHPGCRGRHRPRLQLAQRLLRVGGRPADGAAGWRCTRSICAAAAISDGERYFIESFDEYLADVHAVVELARSRANRGCRSSCSATAPAG